MAASAWRAYNEAKKYLLTADLDLNAGLVRAKLIKAQGSSVTSVFTISTFASAGTGQQAANTNTITVSNVAVTAGASAKVIKFDADDLIFTASGGNATSILYCVIGISGGKALCWSRLTTTGSINVNSASTLTLQLNASGILDLSGAVT